MHWRKFGGRGAMDSWTSPVFALRGLGLLTTVSVKKAR